MPSIGTCFRFYNVDETIHGQLLASPNITSDSFTMFKNTSFNCPSSIIPHDLVSVSSVVEFPGAG